MNSAIIRSFELTPCGAAVGDGDDADGVRAGAFSRALRSEDGGLANTSGSWIGPSTTSSKREVFLAGGWTDADVEGRKVGNGDGVRIADSVDVGDEDGVGDSLGLSVAAAVGVGVSFGDGESLSVGLGVGFGDGAGEDNAEAFGDNVAVGKAARVGEGNGVGNDHGVDNGGSVIGFSMGGVSVTLLGTCLGAGLGVWREAEPGSDQPPAFAPLTKLVCNLVWPCSRITGPSNFPWTILPV